MDKKLIASRLQEVNEGLTRNSGALIEVHYRKSKKFGAAARIASLIGGWDVITEYNTLVAATGELGINADTLESALKELRELDYVTLYEAGGEINKIEERIPLLSDRYEAIGEKYLDSKPDDIEKTTVEILDDLLVSPQREREIISRYNLNPEDFNVIRDVGQSADFYKTYSSPIDNSTIVYSPLYHDENPEKFIELIDKYPGEDVTKKIKEIRNFQGMPIEIINDPILIEAIRTGCIPTPSVESTNGKRSFAFTPLMGVGKLEKSILEKARALVACVRYGQYFAGITKIKYPLSILTKLKQTKRLGDHTELLTQYSLLVKLGVARISKSKQFSDRFVFHFIDTQENLQALDYAIQYLTVTEVTKKDVQEDEARQLLLPGIYDSPVKTRLNLKEIKSVPLSKSSVNKINHLLMGGSCDV